MSGEKSDRTIGNWGWAENVALNRKILVVESEPPVRRLYSLALGPSHPGGSRDEPGFEVFLTSNGEEAVSTVAKHYEEGDRIAAGFFDLALPGRPDSIATIRQVRKIDPDFLCTVMAGRDQPRLSEVEEVFGSDHSDEWDCLSKPFLTAEVLQKARCWVSTWNRRRQHEQQVEQTKSLLATVEELNHSLEEKVIERTMEIERNHSDLQASHMQLKHMQGQLLHNEKMASIGQLAAGIAHEINNPIGFVHSNLDTLDRYFGRLAKFAENIQDFFSRIPSGAPEWLQAEKVALAGIRQSLKVDFILTDLKKVLAESNEGTERVKKIVQDLKTFSRLDETKQKYSDINEGIMSTLNIVRNDVKYKADIQMDLGELPQILCYPMQLNQVFMNLIVNAAQAIEDHGKITIRSRLEDDLVVVTVSDTGIGIKKENLQRIFEPFFTTKDVNKGTGLGLSISYSIVKKHHGQILVESEVGVGTTFTVRLPVDGEPSEWDSMMQ